MQASPSNGDGDVSYDDILDHHYWRHRIDLGDGRFTPGLENNAWTDLGLPERLDGRTFLDVGASDGKFAFEAERRGAERVLAIDVWGGDPADSNADQWEVYSSKAGFDLVRSYLDSSVESRRLGVQDLSSDDVGTFDYVLCKDVLPYVDSPLGAVRNLIEVADERLFVKCHVTTSIGSVPAMQFVDAGANKWWPTVDCLHGMLDRAGATVGRSFCPPKGTAEDVPPTKPGRVRGTGVEVCSDHDLDCPLTTVDGGSQYGSVRILLEADDAVRVAFDHETYPSPTEVRRGDRPPHQGWIRSDRVVADADDDTGTPDRVRSLVASAGEVLRDEGILSLARKVAGRVRGIDHYSYPYVVCHATPEPATAGATE